MSMSTPKSYLPVKEREALLREGGMNLVYLAESQEAGRAGDEDTAWAWLSFAELSAQTLLSLKRRTSGQFIREKNLRTTRADAAYGPGWMDCV
ncbi:MAG: hypothetical protein CVT83_07885 [Alphaproteobacteria bacterium HGW-Alphaproteobacteria-5]|nr:MAG: hypothetical protein CVT83_07885 [Alphaproteobacteria bacterium HGW-Alphaproteobacteria-5]